MESDEVVILRVDGKTSDGDCACLCTGENKAARTRRKERVSGKDRSSDVCIVSVEDAKPKNKKAKGVNNCPTTYGGFPPISVSKYGDVELMEVEVDTASGSTASHSSKPSTSGSSASTGVATKLPGTSKKELNEDYLVAMHLHQSLNSKPTGSNLAKDEELARSLQEKEYSMLGKTKSQDVSFVMESKDEPGPSSALPSYSPSGSPPPSSLRVKEVKPSPMNSNSKLHPLLRKHPTCWTECPNCPSDAIRKYHLINVAPDSAEWEVIAKPVVEAGFHVTRVRGSIIIEY